jgi:2-polyprenyl-3-methyl-5-hydroxy-6-metoxy-1,4-benzoquinol methylase
MRASDQNTLSGEDDEAALARFAATMNAIAPFMLPSFRRQRNEFGPAWAHQFAETVRLFAGRTDAELHAAVKGYVNFALDGMRLQKAFEKARRYAAKSYQDTSSAVYHNPDYMFSMYLPGILLSHYLWPHHYRQLLFFQRDFLPRFLAAPKKEFCDIGPGTGFYTRQLLVASPDAIGTAFDISASALEYCMRQVAAFGVAARWRQECRDIVANPSDRDWPFLVCIEVLEHLEDPLSFLKALRRMLARDGCGLISAAVTAPNEDHIYLYNSAAEVAAQIESAGFRIEAMREDCAYKPKSDEPVPINAAFVVTT